MGVVTFLIFMGQNVLGGGAPVGGIATEAVVADIGGAGAGKVGAPEAVADILDFPQSGRSFPVKGRATPCLIGSVCSSVQLETAASSDCRLTQCCSAHARSFAQRAGPFLQHFLGRWWWS